MRNTKTFITKSNTIIRGNYANTGFNPVMELNYGNMLTRGIVYFDHTRLVDMLNDKTYVDINKMRHTLIMRNCGGIDYKDLHKCGLNSEGTHKRMRASSFNVILFLIPQAWDGGKGYDYVQDLNPSFHRHLTSSGSNWYNCYNYMKWENEGIYTTQQLSREVDLFTSKNGNQSNVVIAYEHFDIGNEDLVVDITSTVNKFITGELCNYGIGIAFSPAYEEMECEEWTHYCGFFTNNTHTFYAPYVETTYDEVIEDDRSKFYLDKDNKLYFYANVGGHAVNLDELPVCHINDIEYEVHQCTKGVYFININLSSDEYEMDTMYYDVWSNIKYRGKEFKTQELSFVTLADEAYFQFGLPSADMEVPKFQPMASGINYKEQIRRGDIRKVNIECKIPYTSSQQYAVDGIEYRLYVVEEQNRQIDVIKWSKVERAYNENYFLIDTNDLIPTRYHIDIRIKYDNELIHHYDIMEFDIINDQLINFN